MLESCDKYGCLLDRALVPWLHALLFCSLSIYNNIFSCCGLSCGLCGIKKKKKAMVSCVDCGVLFVLTEWPFDKWTLRCFKLHISNTHFLIAPLIPVLSHTWPFPDNGVSLFLVALSSVGCRLMTRRL